MFVLFLIISRKTVGFCLMEYSMVIISFNIIYQVNNS
jgi:hypothetical protein